MKTLSQIKALPIKLLALSFLLVFNFQTAKCQQLYSTSEGRIWIIAIVKDTAVNILSIGNRRLNLPKLGSINDVFSVYLLQKVAPQLADIDFDRVQIFGKLHRKNNR